MAEDKGKKKGAKGKSKKPEPRNWTKIGFQVFIVLMIGMAVVAFTLNINWGNKNNNDNTDTGKSFSGIADGLRLVPANASYARYADLRNDTVLNASIQDNFWLFGTLPPQDIYNAIPQRDLFAIYPAGHFGNFAQQFVSLTDFGTAKINMSWPNYYYIGDVVAKKVNSLYFYTGETKPVVSGRIEAIAPTIFVMYGNNESSYGNYSGLFDEMKWKQVSTDGMTMEMVGQVCNLTYVDKYYAALGPVDKANKSADRLYNYTVVMHVNQTLPDQEREGFALLQGSMEKMGFKRYNVQVYDDYVIIEAQGSLNSCLDDMLLRWDFIKYQPSLL